MTIALTTYTNGATVTGLNNQSSSSFVLAGGIYSFATAGTFSSTNCGLQALGPDGSSWLSCFTALTSAGIQAPLYLPAGTYRFTGTSTSASASIQAVKI